jgi:hypothetical protein
VELADVGSETFRVGSMGSGISVQQDPGMMNERARLYAQMSLMPVSKGAGLGDFPSRCRKKASWRDSTVRIDDTISYFKLLLLLTFFDLF